MGGMLLLALAAFFLLGKSKPKKKKAEEPVLERETGDGAPGGITNAGAYGAYGDGDYGAGAPAEAYAPPTVADASSRSADSTTGSGSAQGFGLMGLRAEQRALAAAQAAERAAEARERFNQGQATKQTAKQRALAAAQGVRGTPRDTSAPSTGSGDGTWSTAEDTGAIWVGPIRIPTDGLTADVVALVRGNLSTGDLVAAVAEILRGGGWTWIQANMNHARMLIPFIGAELALQILREVVDPSVDPATVLASLIGAEAVQTVVKKVQDAANLAGL